MLARPMKRCCRVPYAQRVGKRTSYPPGAFSWVDLVTADAAASKAFYSDLFGWDVDDTGIGDGYTIFRLDGDAVGGLLEVSDATTASVAPPTWTSFVTVADADIAAKRAVQHGGKVRSEPNEMFESGRTAVLEDPHGALFAVWQPLTRIGAERVNDIGCLCINELATTDIDGARAFYQDLFGWTTEMVDTGPGGPTIVAVYNDGTLNANMSDSGGAPPHWRPYFAVESVLSALERVQVLGGTVAFGPIPIPNGSFAGVLDPQGALFGLFTGPVDP
jgi:uncharacterized protein